MRKVGSHRRETQDKKDWIGGKMRKAESREINRKRKKWEER